MNYCNRLLHGIVMAMNAFIVSMFVSFFIKVEVYQETFHMVFMP